MGIRTNTPTSTGTHTTGRGNTTPTAARPEHDTGSRPVRPAVGTPRAATTVRTCVPARAGRSGYREPADAAEDPDAHIVRGED